MCYHNIRARKTNDRHGGIVLTEKPKYYIVENTALPKVLVNVMEAKALLASGKAKTVNDAALSAGISRSAFYKYKDLIRPFHDMSVGRIITFRMLLRDEPGVLSGVLGLFAGCEANILTIHQTIPGSGQAPVTISAETKGMTTGIDEFIEKALLLDGVISFEPLAGE